VVSALTSWLRKAVTARFFPHISLLAITLLGGVIRFLNLANPPVLVFDETYYVKDAYTLGQFGSERVWPENANLDFESGNPDVYEDLGSYVVHPAFGKWLIWLGINLFGVESSFSWRFTTALIGTLTIPLLMLIARELTKSAKFSAVAGFLIAIEGHSVVLSRTAILDGLLTFFSLVGLWFLIRADRAQRLKVFSGKIGISISPWLIAMGLSLGLASSIKWSGLYFLAAFGLFTFFSDWQARTRSGYARAGAIYQGFVNAVVLLAVSFATYLTTWSGWIGDAKAWGRNAEENWWLSLLSYHQQILSFHTGLDSDHPYQANAFQWLINLRPTAFYFEEFSGSERCGLFNECVVAITAMPNLLIWFGGVAATIWLIRNKLASHPAKLVITGFIAAWLPWVFFLERTAFQFYAVLISPFFVLALTLALQHYLNRGYLLGLWVSREKKLVLFLAAAFWIALFYLSLWTGLPVPYEFWRVQLLLPFWI
jgi:dolichyl-phosphate-mannose--protein O-mannosyl transferase